MRNTNIIIAVIAMLAIAFSTLSASVPSGTTGLNTSLDFTRLSTETGSYDFWSLSGTYQQNLLDRATWGVDGLVNTSFTTANDNSFWVDQYSINFGARLYAPIHERFTIFAGAGVGIVLVREFSGSDDTWGYTLSTGAEWDVYGPFSLTTVISYSDLPDWDIGRVWSYTAQLAYTVTERLRVGTSLAYSDYKSNTNSTTIGVFANWLF